VTLFRPESLHSQRQSWLGSIHLMQPLGLVWLTFGVLATLVVVSTFFLVAELGRKITLTGVLLPDQGLVRVTSPVAGTLTSWSVQEDQWVATGSRLLEMQEQPSVPGAGARQGVEETIAARTHSLAEAARQTTSLLEIQQTAWQQRKAALLQELAQWETQARWQQQRLELAEQALERLQALRVQNFASDAQVQTKNEDVLGLRADGVAMQRQRMALQRELQTLEAEAKQVPLKAAQQLGEFQRESAELTELAERSRALWAPQRRVVAPLNAQVSYLPVARGQSVVAGEVLAWLTPQGSQLQAQLYAPSRAIGLLRPGQAVRLRVQAFAYQHYGWLPGRVLRVASTPSRGEDVWSALPQPPAPELAAVREPLYRVTVALARQDMPDPQGGSAGLPLRTGMQLEADVVLEKRRLVAWLFDSLPIGR